jgi:hypothetical protein
MVAIYHAIGGVLVRKGRSNITPPAPTSTRPSGAGYVRYEDLYTTGNDLRAVIKKVTGGNILTLPEGTFTFSDFNDPAGYYEGVRVPSACGGIWGSGAGTIIQMNAGTSTQANNTTAIPTAGGTNQCYLIGFWYSNQVLRNCTVHGTEQGHLYNGVRFAGSSGTPITNNLVQDVTFKGAARGASGVPPGETFTIGTNHANSFSVINCELDGRDDGGNKTAASLIGPNNSSNILVQDTYVHDTIAGSGIALYRCDTIQLVRLKSWNPGTSAHYGNCINLEECSGNITITAPNLQVNRASGNTGWHIGINSSTADGYSNDPNITITDPVNDNGPDNGCLSIMIGATYAGGPQAQTSLPTVTKGGATLTWLDKSVSIAGADPTKNAIRYHS